MSDTVEIAPPAVPQDRSEAQHEARLAKATRERRIIELLNRGVSVAEIAEREDVGEKHMRALVRDVLERRMPQPPVQFVALQVNRLNEALRVSFDAMSGANLQAVDRVVKIVRELDRYHGFTAAERWGLPDAPMALGPADDAVIAGLVARIRQGVLEEIARANAGAPETLRPRDPAPQRDGALASALDSAGASPIRRQIAPQGLEKIESGPGNGMAPVASDPQDLVPQRDGAFARALDSHRRIAGPPGNRATNA
jgi:hypothetical protein